MREVNRVTVAEAVAIQQQVANYTPKQWEDKVRQLLVEARNANTVDGYWRDKDRSNRKDNQTRMAGKLDYEAWVTITYETVVPGACHRELVYCLPSWKRTCITAGLANRPMEEGIGFTLDLECKTGGGKPNAAQRRSIARSLANPGRHAWVVYPHDLYWLRKLLGI